MSQTWMLTASGVEFDLRFIDPEKIKLEDIAHHLGQLNRYTGACRRPMSVAEHSLFVCEIVERTLPLADPAVLLAALMHDAHEAYTCDMGSPMKRIVGAAWTLEEERIQRAVLARFGLLTGSTSASKLIHWADMTALVTERRALLPPLGAAWEAERLHEPVDYWDFSCSDAFSWNDWRALFLERYHELDYQRNAKHLRLVPMNPGEQTL